MRNQGDVLAIKFTYVLRKWDLFAVSLSQDILLVIFIVHRNKSLDHVTKTFAEIVTEPHCTSTEQLSLKLSLCLRYITNP